MADLTDLSSVSGEELSEEQIRGLLAQIDLDIMNLVREGKLSALKYGGSTNSPATDRASNLRALLEARRYYEQLLRLLPSWEISRHVEDDPLCGSS